MTIIQHKKFLQKNTTPRSIVALVEYEGELWVMKTATKTLLDNEEYALNRLKYSGYTPARWIRIDLETLLMEYIVATPITDFQKFTTHCWAALSCMHAACLRHGDLTVQAIISRDNRPVIIDWGESRQLSDPVEDKRPEGDTHWLKKYLDNMYARHAAPQV